MAKSYLTPRWQRRRLEVFNKDNFTCQWCGETEKTLHVHHFCYVKAGGPWDSEDSDMITLCCDCHEFQHLKGVPKIIHDLHCILIINPIKHGESIKILVELCLNEFKNK